MVGAESEDPRSEGPKAGQATAKLSSYKTAIHEAVLRSGDRDAYTGRPMRWDQISRYNNAASKRGGRAYKKKFGDLPTVDHIGEGLGEAHFAICAWRVNDAKSDLTRDEFLEVCWEVLDFARKGK